MELTVQSIEEEIARQEVEKAGHLAMYHKTDGAIQALMEIVRLLKGHRDHLTPNEFAQIVAGPGATASVEEYVDGTSTFSG